MIDSNGKNFKSFTINPKYSGIQCPGNRGKLTDTDVEKINKYYKEECDSRGLQLTIFVCESTPNKSKCTMLVSQLVNKLKKTRLDPVNEQ